MSIGKNIKKLREMYDLSQKELAKIAGVSDKAVSTWENDLKEPRMGAIQKMADHFKIKKSDIIEENGIENLSKNKDEDIIPLRVTGNSVTLPLYGSISAGIPLEMIEVKEYINVPKEIAETYPDAFLLKVSGDSMNKIIPSGAIAVISPSEPVKNGDIAAVAVNGCEATIKRFYKFKDGITLEPESTNPIHKTQFYSRREQEFSPIYVKGKLVWYMAPFNIKF